MSTGIALHDGGASLYTGNTSDESTGCTSVLYLYINRGGGVLDIELSTCHKADQTSRYLRCLYFYCRIVFRIVLILMVICEDAIHRQIRTRLTEKHAGICRRSILRNFIIS